MTRLQLELGGKNAIYVDRTADLALAADLVVKSAFGLTGQSCTAASRVIVNREIELPFRVRLIERVKRWKVGPGTAQDVNILRRRVHSTKRHSITLNQEGWKEQNSFIQLNRVSKRKVTLSGRAYSSR